MARLALSPVPLARATLVNLTGTLADLSANTGVTFTSDGTVFLAVATDATSSTAVISIGTTIEGQAATPITTATLATSATSFLGPFPSDFNQTGTNAGQVFIDFGAPAHIAGVALLKYQGVN